jgi:hypothetical protein
MSSYNTSSALYAAGTVFSVAYPTGSNTYVTIGEVKSCAVTAAKYDTEDVTNLSSPYMAGSATTKSNNIVRKELHLSSLSPASVKIEALYTSGSDAGQKALQNAFGNAATCDFKIALPVNYEQSQANVGDTFTFSGFLLSQPVPTSIASDGKAMSFETEIQVNSDFTVTAGA